MDGHPLAKKGQAGRAFGAAYMSSLLGGIAGAFLLAISFPILRPIILYLGSPELLAICVFGLSMVAALSGKAPLKGMAAAGLGLLVAMIGSDPQTGTLRWTFESLYLWDGIPLVPITLGIFAIPELADLAIARLSIASGAPVDARVGQLAGIRDALRHWWLVLRCSWLGASLGAVPGIGSAVIDWIAYGHALKTEKNVENFGQGDIRGVIAPESSNNAKEGCALVPTLAFGVPGSASMAILLGAFMMHGLVPGPRMLDEHLDVTYSIVWSIALANLLGTGLCLAFSNQLAKVASVRVGILLPLVLAIIFMGAFQGSRQWGDLYVLLGFGVFGWIMKRLDWPRPTLILGVVLGGVVERYLFISIGRYQWTWIARPVVIIFFAVALFSVLGPLLRNLRTAVRQGWSFKTARPRRSPSMLFTVVVVGLLAGSIVTSSAWGFEAKIVPQAVGYTALLCALLSLVREVLTPLQPVNAPEGEARLERGETLRRAAIYFAWCFVYLLLAKVVGMLSAMFLFVALCVRFWGGETLARGAAIAACITAFSWTLFDRLLSVPWPQTFLGTWVPALQPYLR